MNYFKYTLIFSFLALFFIACNKDELTPNEDAAKAQQAGIDLLNSGVEFDPNGGGGGGTGGGGNGGGGTGGGGGTTIKEYFSADVDGVSKSDPDPSYQEGFGMKQINASINNSVEGFLVNIHGPLEAKTQDNPTAGYFSNSTNSYSAFNGQLVLDSVTATFIKGTFYFDAVSAVDNDTVSVTNGKFRVKL